MDTNYWKSSPFGEESMFHPGWEEKIKEREYFQRTNSAPLKISIKHTSNQLLKIQVNCVVTISFIVEGEDKKWIGFEHHLSLSSSDESLKIYNEHFDVDNGWTFRVNLMNSKKGSSIIVIQENTYALKFSFDFVDYKNAFNRSDKDKLIEKNKDLIQKDKKCFRVADKELAIILNDKSLVLENYAHLTGFSRMNDYEKKGYVFKKALFLQNKIWKRHTEGDYQLKPYAFAEGQSSCFSNFIRETALCLGVFVYHFILLNGYHVLIILIDNTDNGYTRFKIMDQIKNRDWDDLSNLDNTLLEMTINNYEHACDVANRKDINSSINLCCIKRK